MRQAPIRNHVIQLFDGTWKSVISKLIFGRTINRWILVDIRYALWLMDVVYPAPRLLRKMVVTLAN